MESKKCTKCGEVKILSDFYKEKRLKDGVAYSCIDCEKERVSKWRLKNRAKFNSTRRRWCNDNKQKVSMYNKTFYENNKESMIARSAYWRENNICLARNTNKEWYTNNKYRVLVSQKEKVFAMSDSYIVNCLRSRIADCPPELIEAKRAQLKLHRLINKQ